ncbi:hypothetical protein F4680DRAFT_420885 [Xylaria scruposa]|nr:hypothetical protein F4680DRAFT_420885 [Xylaria scruposa]
MVTGENPFIRFKNHIDNNVRRGWDSLFRSPPSSTSAPTSSPDLVSPPLPSSSSSSMPSSSKSKMTDRMATAAEEPEQQTTTMGEVHTWSIQSPYSPLNLQHLPQPTPRGAPHARDVNFTFRDAFEDLLVAGSGQPLPSMREMVWKKRREVLPFWEGNRGLHVTQWVGRLAALGLWDAYFPMEPGAKMDVERQLYFREGGSSSRPAWGMKRDGAWGGPAWDDRAQRTADADRSSFDAKGVWDAVWKVALDRDQWGGGDREADVEEELYGTSTPNSPANNRGLEPDSKNGRRVVEWQEGTGGSKESSAPPEVTTTVYADGSKYVRTTERFERDGKTKVTTTAQHFDPAGNLTSESRETSTTRTWSGGIPGAEASFSWSWNNDNRTQRGKTNDGGHEDKDVDDREVGWRGRKDEKKGWFWNR